MGSAPLSRAAVLAQAASSQPEHRAQCIQNLKQLFVDLESKKEAARVFAQSLSPMRTHEAIIKVMEEELKRNNADKI